MEPSFSVPVHPSDLARAVAALANSSGGCFIIEADHKRGREALTSALTEIVPPPVVSGSEMTIPPEKKRQTLRNGIARPATVTVRDEEKGLIVTVLPGESLCTHGGKVVILEDGNIRTLTLTEVVRRAGSGG